jgi:Fe(3+) dicitrate transport protein
MRKGFPLIVISTFLNLNANAQKVDTLKSQNLPSVEIINTQIIKQVYRMNEVNEMNIMAGKKNEVINISALDADLTINNARQLFSKVPGISIWENDGSGIQTSIATRGLNPNRSWEFNVRQNGVDISSDVFGYPEAYFTPPTEAVERIEIVRGAASLQFGPQFGGLLNYVIKKAPANKPVSFEARQTLGAYGLNNSYTSIGLNKKSFSFFGYFHHRTADGWRENSKYSIGTGYASLKWAPSPKFYAELQYTRMNYESQQPGGLTDSMFNVNAKQSVRSRNWMSTPWNILNLETGYNFNENTKIQLKVFALAAERNSIGNLSSIQISDTINATTNNFNNRQLDRDTYSNLGAELRFISNWKLFGKYNTLATGVRLFRGNTHRKANGKGSNGNDFDLNLASGTWGRDMFFQTLNQAAFAENIFRISPKLTITPGIRLEMVEAKSEGYINTSAIGKTIPQQRNRTVVLAGIGAEFKVSKTTNIYGNFSQSFRPVTFAEITPSATTDTIDPNLKDASGYNTDLGYRGDINNFIHFDVSLFYLHYGNRIGNLVRNGNQFRTNIGTTASKGAEIYAEINLFQPIKKLRKFGSLNVFASLSFIDAQYTRWDDPAKINDPTKTLVKRSVENAPQYIHRLGANYSYKKFSISYQINSVGSAYADALNTEKPNANATVGLIPAYVISDISFSFTFLKIYRLNGGINNLADSKYFTRRAGGYPGPGILPGMGRTWFVGFGLSI